MNEINKALEVLKDDSKPRNRADLLRVLTEWNRATGVFVVSGSWFYEVQGMLEDAFDCGAALAASQFTPLAWVHEDELPEGFPYEQLFPYSKVDIVRMFPIFGPSAGQCGESCERAKLCGACARGLEEVPEPAASEREAFEAWARDQWGDRPVPNNAWLGWQGRAALAASQPAPVEDKSADAVPWPVVDSYSGGRAGRRFVRVRFGDGPETVEFIKAAPAQEQAAPVVTDEMVGRFLGWRLPDNFGPDCLVSFDKERAKASGSWPRGTNLLDADQAKAMLQHVLGATLAAQAAPEGNERDAFRAWLDSSMHRGERAAGMAWDAWLASAARFKQSADDPGETSLPYEAALFELIDKILPGLDSGDLLDDAKAASKHLDALVSDQIPCAPKRASYLFHCDMGVGCNEVGICFAAAHGQPDCIGRSAAPAPSNQNGGE